MAEAVEHRLVADCPVAVQLSGGVDSSAVAGIGARCGPLTAFTVRFPGAADESAAAVRTAQWLGVPHHLIDVGPEPGQPVAVAHGDRRGDDPGERARRGPDGAGGGDGGRGVPGGAQRGGR